MDIRSVSKEQYRTTDLLETRVRTHRLYSERPSDPDGAARKTLRLSGREAILEIGCGPGAFLRYLREKGHEGDLIGLDRSSAMIAEAREAAAARGIAALWLQADATASPFGDRRFDRAVGRHMLYHVPDIPAALREIRRVLKPDGVALFSTNSDRSLPRIRELLEDLAAEFGIAPMERIVGPFCIENAEAVLSAAFERVETFVRSNALIFDRFEPIRDYAATLLPSVAPGEEDLQRRMLDWLSREASLRLQRCGGVWRDPKDAGLYRCHAS
jgi:ubiquinone/menaquinone biosynthesis C-methylase UbiE